MVTRATTVRCQGTGTAAAVAAIPAEPPMTVPRLKQPCSVGSTARPGDALHVGAVHIDRHFAPAHARAEQTQSRGDQGRRRHGAAHADDDRARDDQDGAERDHWPGAEPGHETAGTQDADHGTDGQAEQDKTHLPGGQVQLIADIRGARDPGGHGDAWKKEQEEQSLTASAYGAVYQGGAPLGSEEGFGRGRERGFGRAVRKKGSQGDTSDRLSSIRTLGRRSTRGDKLCRECIR